MRGLGSGGLYVRRQVTARAVTVPALSRVGAIAASTKLCSDMLVHYTSRVYFQPMATTIKIKNDSRCGYYETPSLAEINNGNSHIIEDDHCYLVVNRVFKPGGNAVDTGATDLFKPTPWIFPEALEALRKLPLRPSS